MQVDSFLAITVDKDDPANANLAQTNGIGMGTLHNFADVLERYARDSSAATWLPVKSFREQLSGVDGLVLADDTVQFAVLTLTGDKVTLHLRAPKLAPFHAIAVAGVLRTQAAVPVLAQMVMQATSQVIQGMLQANAQAAQDARVRQLIVQGGGRTS